MTKTADAIVVGGGINGVSIAFNLAKRGVRVALVEKTFIAGGPTGRSSAIIRQHYSHEVTARIALRSLRIFQNFDEAVGGECDFRPVGFAMGARPQDLEMLQANVAMQRSVGIQTRVVTGEDLQDLEPFISIEGIVAAAYQPESGYADPSSTAGSYAKRAKELGATLMLGTKVLSIAVEKGRVAGVETDKGPLASGAVIVAAGPWSPQIIDPLGVELPVEASRHQVCVYKWPAEFLSRLVYVDFVETVYMRPETGNLTLVGSIEPEEGEDKVRDPDRFDTGVAFETISRYAQGVSHRYPGMASGQYATGYSALFDITPDWHPILDKMPGIEGLYCAAGGSGHGFKLAPAVGEMMAELVLHGKKPGDDIDLFSFHRFAEGRLVRSKYDYNIVG